MKRQTPFLDQPDAKRLRRSHDLATKHAFFKNPTTRFRVFPLYRKDNSKSSTCVTGRCTVCATLQRIPITLDVPSYAAISHMETPMEAGDCEPLEDFRKIGRAIISSLHWGLARVSAVVTG